MASAIFKFYEGTPRQGPGSKETTLHALGIIKKKLPPFPKIVDIGCGTGAQTLDLAENIEAEITAIDIYHPFLTELLNKAKKRRLKSSIKTLNQSMNNLSIPESEFHLIWSEGAIYLMGMEDGLRMWQKFLTPGGFIAFTEVSWFKNDPPEKIDQFWSANYPAMKTVQNNIECIKNIGFNVIDHFSISSDIWWDNYYNPLIDKINKVQNQDTMDSDLLNLITETNEEINLFRAFSDWYGYEFYIVQPK